MTRVAGEHRLALVAVLTVALASAAGCGPIRSSSTIVDAAAELAAAETAQGRAMSPYEMVAAEAYLHKAREEESYSDFEAAVSLARKSRDCARVARVRAERQTRKDLGVADAAGQTEAQCYAGPPGARPVQGLDALPTGKTAPAAAGAGPVIPAVPRDKSKDKARGTAEPAKDTKKKVVKPADEPADPDEVLPEGE